jgi:hypothetical protein
LHKMTSSRSELMTLLHDPQFNSFKLWIGQALGYVCATIPHKEHEPKKVCAHFSIMVRMPLETKPWSNVESIWTYIQLTWNIYETYMVFGFRITHTSKDLVSWGSLTKTMYVYSCEHFHNMKNTWVYCNTSLIHKRLIPRLNTK